MSKDIRKVAEVVRHWMPEASEEELEKATVNLRNYLAVIYRTACRPTDKEMERREKSD